ncbi:hypothetical protein PENSPDRAFT_684824 [Peniophora sp. CONT]|nr:hypothetical protein PENSPDRAFT_684824 [Peniophora sp. CONT]
MHIVNANALAFPSIVSRERSSAPDAQISFLDFEILFRTSRVSKAALDAPFVVDAATNAIELLENSLDWLDNVTRTLRWRSQHLSALKNGHLNGQQPIARLPPELIRLVFEYHAEEQRLGPDPNSLAFYVPGHWLELSSVCRNWRLNLFHTPAIWANGIFHFHLEQALVSLPLAKDVPLNIDLKYSRRGYYTGYYRDDDGLAALAKLSRLFTRAWRISYVPYVEKDALAFIEIVCSKPLPNLQTLRIIYPDEDLAGDFLPQALAVHSNLRFLTLTNVFLTWPPVHGQLLSLNIDLEACYNSGRTLAHITVLFDVLARNMSLRTLKLCYSFDDVNLPDESPASRTHLPHLKNLYLRHNGPEASMYVLDRLRLPSLQELSMEDELDHSHQSALRMFTSISYAWASEPTDDPPNFLLLKHPARSLDSIKHFLELSLPGCPASLNERLNSNIQLSIKKMEPEDSEFLFERKL